MVMFKKCPVGSYCPYTNMTSPILCPVGSYCPDEGMTSPTICPVGTCPNTGMISSLLNDSEYCNSSGSCLNKCCAKYAWYSTADSCIPAGVTGRTKCM